MNTRDAWERQRLADIPVLAMLYPSTTPVDLGDLLGLLAHVGNGGMLTLEEVLAWVTAMVCEQIAPFLASAATSEPEDET